MRLRNERGAVALEFALLLPVLIAILLGIIEFGLAFNSQLQVTNAAREGARAAAVWSAASAAPNATTAAGNAATAAASSLTPALTPAMIAVKFTASGGAAAASCVSGGTVTVTIGYPYHFLTGFFGTGYQQSGKAAMRCGG